jgi:hypothetical protein
MDFKSGYEKEWKYWTPETDWVYNSKWVSHYPQARNLGLPKCPIPVFFKFDINEVLNTFPVLCEISDGNMQKSNTRKGHLSQMFNRFSFDDVYSTIKNTSDGEWRTYLDKSQQEFLVKDELDFSKLKNIEIIVRTEEDKQQLISLVDTNIESMVTVDYYQECFHNNNKVIYYEINNNNEFSIRTDYQGNGNQSGEFWLETDNDYEIVSGKENIISKDDTKLIFYPKIELLFSNKACFTTFFKDKVTNKPEWEVVKYCTND